VDGADPELMESLLRAFFADYLRLVEPDTSVLLDLDRITFFEAPLEGPGVAARVPGRQNGERVAVLAFIEPDTRDQDEVAARIARSLARMAVPYGEPVLASVLILQEGDWRGCRLESGIASHLGGIELLRLYYTAFSLSAARAELFLERPEPLAWAFAALIRPTQRTCEEHRAACRERIERADLDAERRGLLRRVVGG